MNAIYVRRRKKVIVPDGTGATPANVLASFNKNLESLGFILSERVIERLKALDPLKVDAFYRTLVKELRELVGAHRVFKPFYPNFPDEVMSLGEAELYFNAIRHYWTGWRPTDAPAPRPELADASKFRVIDLGTKDDFEGIFTLLCKAKTALSPQDKEDLKWFVAQYRDGVRRLLPPAIPCKENLAVLAAELMRNAPGAADVLDEYVKTATDVLRVAVALSGGDVSLAEASKFGKFRRAERARLLGWVERAPNRTEDMLRHAPRWVRLGERLHPGEYATRFPNAASAFDVIRNDRPFETFNGRVESALLKRDTGAVLELLDARPGELARRLDHLARTSADPRTVLERFAARAAKVSTPVLLQVLAHFRHRSAPTSLRAFFPKGNVGNLYAVKNELPALAPGVADGFAAACESALLARFAELPKLGKCFLDPRMANYLVPFAQRSAAKALRTLVRGSRLPLPRAHTLRFFVWWKNGNGRVDVDLSAAMYDREYKYVDTLAYYNLKTFGAHHSGDITDAPNGAAEFIDVDVKRLKERGVRFVVMCINSYSQQPFCDLPECFAGWMAREAPNTGAPFEPKTVVDKVDVAANTRVCLPAIFDLVGGEVVWADIALTSHPRFPNNVHHNLSGVSVMLRALTQLPKPDLHTLFALHVRARGEAVPTPEGADTVFSPDRGLTPFDLDRIAADFM